MHFGKRTVTKQEYILNTCSWGVCLVLQGYFLSCWAVVNQRRIQNRRAGRTPPGFETPGSAPVNDHDSFFEDCSFFFLTRSTRCL